VYAAVSALAVSTAALSDEASQRVRASGRTFYVSPSGSDRAAGGPEDPFATLARARDAARAVRPRATGPITIVAKGGTYFLSEPLVLGPEDSGTEKAPLVICAAEGADPVISGGVALQLAWEPYRDHIMKARVPAAVDEARLDELFVEGVQQRQARYPNYDPAGKYFDGTSPEANSPARVRSWRDPVGGYLHALHEGMWGSKHYRITGVEDGSLKLQGGWQENRAGGRGPVFRGGFHQQYLFVENVFEELDAPGEWYYDRKTRTLYLYPMPAVDLARAPVVAGGLLELVVLDGSAERPVRHVRLEGLSFRHTRRIFMEPYERLLRGDWSFARLAAVRITGAEDCAVRDASFTDLGGNAVLVIGYNRRIEVLGSRFANIGETAVALVGDVRAVRSPAISYENTLPQDQIDLTPGPKSPDYPARCRVHDNLIHDVGRVGKQTAGVFISMAEEITVSHNTIFRVPRAGICINDGTWGGHVIEFNDVFDTARETGDHGPFNSWGRDRWWKTSYNEGGPLEPFARSRATLDAWKTTHIRNNRFAHPAGGHSWGIDLDDGSSNYHIYDNLALNMGVKLREGFFRRVENNIMVNGFGGFHIWVPGSDDVVARNVIVDGAPYRFIRANPTYARTIDHNLFWNGGRPIEIEIEWETRIPLDQWRKQGFDTHSVVADPLFTDPERGDYSVRPGSPALALGFRNFPMDRFGVLKPAFQREVAKARRAPAATR
jgi:hypothetical protein